MVWWVLTHSLTAWLPMTGLVVGPVNIGVVLQAPGLALLGLCWMRSSSKIYFAWDSAEAFTRCGLGDARYPTMPMRCDSNNRTGDWANCYALTVELMRQTVSAVLQHAACFRHILGSTG